MSKALLLGIVSSFFFAFTFIFNRSMNLSDGYWLFSACLRYIFMLPMMAVIVWKTKGMKNIMNEIRLNLKSWILWSTVGFGLFYMPLSMASLYGTSWFIAASWQLTIVAGILLTPFFGKKLPVKNLIMSGIILVGVILLQTSNAESESSGKILWVLFLILIAAFSYPLGNRKMMAICPTSLTTIQRVFGMTLCSMPFWGVLSGISVMRVGLPSGNQLFQSLIVALFSGVVATILFFKATDMVKDNPKQLAVIEATQSGEVLFTLLGGILFLGDSLPTPIGYLGILLIVAGMIANSIVSSS